LLSDKPRIICIFTPVLCIAKTTAILLCFFLGFIGIHQFYLKNNLKGILYLIFSWTLIPLLFAIYDFIMLLSIDEEKFNDKYNNPNPIGKLGLFGSKKIKSGLSQYFNEYPQVSKESEDFIEKTLPKIIINGRVKGRQNSEIVNNQIQTFIEEQISISGLDEKQEIKNYISNAIKIEIGGIDEVINETYFGTIITDFLSDDALDPEEIEELKNKAIELNIEKYKTTESIRKEYKYYVKNWEFDNGIIAEVPSDFILNKNEKCIYRKNNVEILEQKEVTKRINYSGPRARVKIAKGISYNFGSYNYSTEKETKRISKGIGILNITTKRILFKTAEKSTTIRLSAIVDLKQFNDGIMIFKSTGNPLIIIDENGLDLYQSVNGAIRIMNK